MNKENIKFLKSISKGTKMKNLVISTNIFAFLKLSQCDLLALITTIFLAQPLASKVNASLQSDCSCCEKAVELFLASKLD